MQFFVPEWVAPLEEAGDGHERKFKIKALRDGLAWTQRNWVEATADTGVGNPFASTSEKGRRCWEDLALKLSSFFVDLAQADLDNLYE